MRCSVLPPTHPGHSVSPLSAPRRLMRMRPAAGRARAVDYPLLRFGDFTSGSSRLWYLLCYLDVPGLHPKLAYSSCYPSTASFHPDEHRVFLQYRFRTPLDSIHVAAVYSSLQDIPKSDKDSEATCQFPRSWFLAARHRRCVLARS